MRKQLFIFGFDLLSGPVFEHFSDLRKNFYNYFFMAIYIYIYIYISSSSCHAASTDIPDPLSPLLPIVHHLWQVFRASPHIVTELLYVCSSWSSWFCSAIWGVHRSTSLMSSSLLLQQCPACPVRLTWIVFVIGGRWPYSWCFVGCCLLDLFNIARSILV